MKTISQEEFNQIYGKDVGLSFDPEIEKRQKVFSRLIADAPSDIGETLYGIGQTTVNTANRIKEAGQATAQGKQGFMRGLAQTVGLTAGGISKGIGELFTGAGKAVLTPEMEQKVKETVTPVAQKVAQIPAVQNFLADYESLTPEQKRDVDALFGVGTLATDLATLGVGGRGVQVGKEALTTGAERVAKGATELAGNLENIRPATQQLIERSGNIIKPKPSPVKAVGEVLQAKKPLTTKEVAAFRNINTEGVKTFKELSDKIDNSISNLVGVVDESLDNTTQIPLAQLVTKTTTEGGRTVERNFVDTALKNLQELYQKTLDDVSLANIEDVISKANTTGLTRKEVNDISRIYGQEFGQKAFNKVGEPLTSVNAQAYENIRTGLKDVARSGIGGEAAKTADKTISSLYNVKTLVDKNVQAVQKLQQRIAERGLLEKVGYTVAKYGDVFTGGSLRGIVGGLLPRGAGYKLLNALDLEERLQSNLKIIREALEANSDDAIINATKKLDSSFKTPAIGEIVDVSDDLIKEARKYKSAEEFVKARPTYYRGEGGSNVAQGKALLAEGKHFASDSEYPKGFGKVGEYVIKPDAKVLDIGDSTFAEISQKLGIPEKRYISPKELSEIAKEMGYNVLKYDGVYKSTGKSFTHTVDLTGDSFITKSQLTDIWKKANQ